MDQCDDNDKEYNLTQDLSDKKHSSWMRLVLVEKYKEGVFDRKTILENGLGTIQGPCKVRVDFDNFVEMNK